MSFCPFTRISQPAIINHPHSNSLKQPLMVNWWFLIYHSPSLKTLELSPLAPRSTFTLCELENGHRNRWFTDDWPSKKKTWFSMVLGWVFPSPDEKKSHDNLSSLSTSWAARWKALRVSGGLSRWKRVLVGYKPGEHFHIAVVFMLILCFQELRT